MNTNEQSTVNIGFEDLLQLLELANRLVTLGYTSRTESNFVRNLTKGLAASVQQQQEAAKEAIVDDEQNNKVDESNKDVIS